MKVNQRTKTPRGAIAYTAVFKVNRSDTLLEFLLRKCNTSRNNVKSLLARRQVVVNGAVVTQFDFPLAKDDEVKLAKSSVSGEVPTAPRAKVKTRAPKEKQTIKIIYEDDDFIAIDKPVGLLSVESDKDAESAYSYLSQYLSAQSKNARPFVLHRIDKETSGVLVFAKNAKIHSMMKLRWGELVTLREYYAVVEGVMENKEDTLVCYLKENRNNLMYATNDPTGQKAVTKYTVCAEKESFSLLRVQIETGRKNQIRVQMKEIGHAVVGDEKYGSSKNPLKRLGLHASKLCFTHPITKAEITVAASVPREFRAMFGQ